MKNLKEEEGLDLPFSLENFLSYYYNETSPIEKDVVAIQVVIKHAKAYELLSDDEKSLYISVIKFKLEKMRHDPNDTRKQIFLSEYDKVFRVVASNESEETPYRQREMSEKLLLMYYLVKCSVLDSNEGENKINFSFINT